MKIFHYQDVEAKDAEEGASGLRVRWLITKKIGAENFAMRLKSELAMSSSFLQTRSINSKTTAKRLQSFSASFPTPMSICRPTLRMHYTFNCMFE